MGSILQCIQEDQQTITAADNLGIAICITQAAQLQGSRIGCPRYAVMR